MNVLKPLIHMAKLLSEMILTIYTVWQFPTYLMYLVGGECACVDVCVTLTRAAWASWTWTRSVVAWRKELGPAAQGPGFSS